MIIRIRLDGNRLGLSRIQRDLLPPDQPFRRFAQCWPALQDKPVPPPRLLTLPVFERLNEHSAHWAWSWTNCSPKLASEKANVLRREPKAKWKSGVRPRESNPIYPNVNSVD